MGWTIFLLAKVYTQLITIKNSYDIANRLRENATTLLDGDMVEVDDIVLGNDVLVTNNTNTMNSLVAIPTTEMEPTKPTCYTILEKIDSFKSIMTHYYTEVKPR